MSLLVFPRGSPKKAYAIVDAKWLSDVRCLTTVGRLCVSEQAPIPTIPISGSTVLITGATGGLGKGIALRFANAGANVVLHHRSSAQIAEEFAEQLREFGTQTLIVSGDIRDEDVFQEMVAKAVSKFGRLDALITIAEIGIAKV